MNWQALGAVGELVGAIGVIVTVAYLAIQVRQNTSSIEGSTNQSLMTLETEIFKLIADNANVYRRGCDDYFALDEDETVQFNYIVAAELSLVFSAHVQYQRNLISAEVWSAYQHGAVNRIKETGYGNAWQALAAEYPKSFRDILESPEIQPTSGNEI
jgi:hypothetical protein